MHEQLTARALARLIEQGTLYQRMLDNGLSYGHLIAHSRNGIDTCILLKSTSCEFGHYELYAIPPRLDREMQWLFRLTAPGLALTPRFGMRVIGKKVEVYEYVDKYSKTQFI